MDDISIHYQIYQFLEMLSSYSLDKASREIDALPFDYFLDFLEKLKKIQYLHPEAVVKDQIQTLKMEIKFLKTFSKCVARNENLKDSSAPAISSIGRALRGNLGVPLETVFSDAAAAIEQNRPTIRYFYEQVSVSSDSYTHMTSDQLLEFINDLMQNLKDLLRSNAALVVSLKSQLVALKEELQFLQNFLHFAKKRCNEQDSLKDLFTESEVVAIDLARLSYTFLANKQNEEPSVEMNIKLSNLLQKIKPTKPEVREMYIRVLKASQFSESSEAYTMDGHLVGAFVDYLLHYILEFLNSKFRFMHPIQDQLKVLDKKLRFMRILLMDPPRQYIDMRSIDAVTTATGLLLFSLNVDEMTEEIAVQMNLKLVNLLEKMNHIEGLAKQIYPKFISSRSKFPRTDGLGFIQSFVENLKELLCRTDTSVTFPKHQIETIQKEFESFTSPLKSMEKRLDQHEEFKSLWTRVFNLGYQAEYVIDSILVNNGPAWCHMLWLSDFVEEIQVVKAEFIDFNTKMAHDTAVDNVEKPFSNALSPQANTSAINEQVVGFEDEEEKLIKLLICGPKELDIVSLVGMGGLGKTTLSKKIFNSNLVEKHFHVRGWCTVSQVYQKKEVLISLLSQVSELNDGGQDTKVTVISLLYEVFEQKDGEDKKDILNFLLDQVYKQKAKKYIEDMLVTLLTLVSEKKDGEDIKDIIISRLTQFSEQNGEKKIYDLIFHLNEISKVDLEHYLYKKLKGRRYLIVLDDIWDIGAWRDLERLFPNDENGSRIMFTTRELDVATEAKLHSDPHSLRSFHDDECWELLKQLVFSKNSRPTKLEEIGKRIAKSCKGVPLSVALIAGILATDKTEDFWNEVSQSLTSRIFDGQTEHVIEMSYKHLPHYLRPCFLYFGAFLEDQEVPARKLIRLWNAEGFVRKLAGRNIEETAEHYLNILIHRSLVSISKRKANGGIKECRIHDLVFHFCKVKSREEKFWQLDGFVSCPATPTYEKHRLCMYYKGDAFIRSRPSGSHVRSLLLHNPENKVFDFNDESDSEEFFSDISFISNNFKFLRVLDLESLSMAFFPDGVEMLVLLKYLALNIATQCCIPASIARLCNLETFVLRVLLRVVPLPETIWKMRKLRHLHISPDIVSKSDYQRTSNMFIKWNTYGLFHFQTRQASPEEDCNRQMLDSLETISILYLTHDEQEEVIRKIPNVRKLRCSLWDLYANSGDDCHFPNLDLLSKLESLHVINNRKSKFLQSSELISFPSKLKKLNLTRFHLRRAEILILGRLENLEVLELQTIEFEEDRWDMIDVEFPSLRHLELRNIRIKEWNTSNENFPCLQRLRLLSICGLREVPSCFGSLLTLEMIELKAVPNLDMESVWGIQEEQVDNGNDEFKVFF